MGKGRKREVVFDVQNTKNVKEHNLFKRWKVKSGGHEETLYELMVEKGQLKIRHNFHPAQKIAFKALDPLIAEMRGEGKGYEVVVFSSGTGAGKTSLGALKTLVVLMQRVKYTRDSAVAIVASPTYPIQQKTIMPYFRQLLLQRLPKIYGVKNVGVWAKRENMFVFNDTIKITAPDGEILSLEGSMIYFLHLQNPNALEGIHADFIWADEMFMSGIEERIWKVMMDRRRFREGQIFITSTPYKHHNMWAYTEIIKPGTKVIYSVDVKSPAFKKSVEKDRLDWRKLEKLGGLHREIKKGSRDNFLIVIAPSILNPRYSVKQYLDGLKRWGEKEGRARFDGVWDTIIYSHGKLFWAFKPEQHIVESEYAPDFSDSSVWEKWVGVDVGVRDPTAAVWFARHRTSNVFYIYRAYQSIDPRPAVHASIIGGVSREDEIEGIYVDPNFTSGARFDYMDFVKGLEESGVGLKLMAASNSRWEGIDVLNRLFEKNQLFVVKTGDEAMNKLITKFNSFPREAYIEKRLVKYGAKHITPDDHLIDAARYAASRIIFNRYYEEDIQAPSRSLQSPAKELRGNAFHDYLKSISSFMGGRSKRKAVEVR